MGVTFGSSSAPSQITKNLDSLFAQSLAAYKKTLTDNIATTNALLMEIMKGEMYQSQDGGTHIEVPLMYALAQSDWYDGYDEFNTQPVDGITNAVYQWRQMASPIAYSMKELKQNKQKILDLVQSRIKQSELGIKETFGTALLQGNGTSLFVPAASGVNGASGVDPLGLLVKFDPTTSTTVGNINQSTSTWWRNKTKTSAATAYPAFILEWDNIFNSTALGTGGKPNLIPCDQVTYELIVHAFWQKYRQTAITDETYPFQNIIYKGAKIVMDEKICDAYTDVANATTYGTAYFLNTQFINLTYEAETDFVMAEDENGKTFQKPIGGDSRVGHILWMGNTGISNRRKQGVFGKIARTLTES